MKFFNLSALLLCLSACGGMPAIYGVPQDRWERMSEAEQAEAIERFEQMEEINRQTREAAEQARQEAGGEVETDEFCEDPEQPIPNRDACKRRSLFWEFSD
jgi:hypothetical protein